MRKISVTRCAGGWYLCLALLAQLAWAHPPALYRLQLAGTQAGQASSGSVQFIGNATLLIRYQGLTILTDPDFLHKGEWARYGYGQRTQRLTEPGLPLAALPPIDLVLLSHFQEDHFERLTARKLDRNTPVVTTPQAGKRLRELGFKKLFLLDTWDAMQISKGAARLRLTSMPGRQGPFPLALTLPQVMGAMLDFGNAGSASYRIYISGDTMLYDDIAEIPRRFPGADLALLHLGGARLLGIVAISMDGDDGVRMLRLIAPEHAIPIHVDDYDVFKSSRAEFQQAVNDAGLMGKISYLKPGASYPFSAVKRR